MAPFDTRSIYLRLICGQITALSVALTVFVFLFLIASAFIALLFAVPDFRALFFKKDADAADGKKKSKKAAGPPPEDKTDAEQRPPETAPKRKKRSGNACLDGVPTVPLHFGAPEEKSVKKQKRNEASENTSSGVYVPRSQSAVKTDSGSGGKQKARAATPAADGATAKKQKTATDGGTAKSKKSEK